MTEQFRDKCRAWWQASRPPFYIATLIPLFLGYIFAGQEYGECNPMVFAGVMLACFCLHLNANLANDLFDHLQGVDAGPNIGGSRVLQQGKISVFSLKRVIKACYVFAAILACVGVYVTGHSLILLIVFFGALSSYYYVAPPVKYGHRALGEVFVLINMGFVMMEGTFYALTGEFSAPLLAVSMPVGLMVAGILYFQSLPEIESDKAAGKKTLAGNLGPERAVFLFKIWWPVIWSYLVMLFLSGVCSWPVLLGIVLCLPFYRKASTVLDAVLHSAEPDWFSVDAHGKWVRIMYLICGVAMLFSV